MTSQWSVVYVMIIFSLLLAMLVEVVYSHDQAAEIYLEYHAFEFPFIQDGEPLLMQRCSGDVCYPLVNINGWLKRTQNSSDDSNVIDEYLFIFKIGEYVSRIDLFMGTANFMLNMEHFPPVLQSSVLVPMQFQIVHKATSILVHFSKMTYVVVHPSDFGIQS